MNEDIKSYYTSVCSVCDNKLSSLSSAQTTSEHVTIELSWGYHSLYDTQTHNITLCCNCYNKYLMTGDLGKFIKIENYM